MLIDTTSTIIDTLSAYHQTCQFELLPKIIKSFRKCIYFIGDVQVINGHTDSLYTEVDYVFDKITAFFDPIMDSIDFYIKNWKYQEYICSLFAEIQYYYYTSIVFTQLSIQICMLMW